MARTTKLNDLQLILLTTAAQRDAGNLLPPPDSVGNQHDRITRSVASLIKHGLASEATVTAPDRSWRQEGDHLVGATITDAGRAAIGVEPTAEPGDGGLPEAPTSSSPRDGSKQALVLTLLARPDGATLAELVETTGWQPHTTRAALTGLRKKGHVIARTKRGDVTCYQIGSVA